MKAKVPVIIQDQLVGQLKGMEPTEIISITDDFFLNGPVSKRVAVLDFTADGELCKGIQFVPPKLLDKEGKFIDAEGKDIRIEDIHDIYKPAFVQVNVFGAVHHTMAMFEESDTLGRPLTWAFNAPQLLVVPQAGQWANAFYERDSHSLQFFYFPSKKRHRNSMVYTSLSFDIVAHETGHAILDSIAPDLYHAITPQSLALHEAIADLTALVMAFRSPPLRKTVLDQTGGNLKERITAFNEIAEEFGAHRDAGGHYHRSLRSLLNDEKLHDPHEYTSPHELSEILSGALYTVMVQMHEDRKREIATKKNISLFSASGEALFVAGEHFKRMIFRALDYLPPGEISFADYGRAIIAADRASYPGRDQERNWISDEFVNRNIVEQTDDLTKRPEGATVDKLQEALAEIDLDMLVNSDGIAYDFAYRFRKELQIPEDKPFEVRPRLDVTKLYRIRKGETKEVRECIFKVSWDQEEVNPKILIRGFPARRLITVGTTLAIDWDQRTVRALLTSDTSETQREARDAMLGWLAAEDRLRVGRGAIGPDGKPLRSMVIAESLGNNIRIRNSARVLHIAPI